jgi:hypothetical protein
VQTVSDINIKATQSFKAHYLHTVPNFSLYEGQGCINYASKYSNLEQKPLLDSSNCPGFTLFKYDANFKNFEM